MTIDGIDTLLDGREEHTQHEEKENQGIDQIDTGQEGFHPVANGYELIEDGNTVEDETPVGFFVDDRGYAWAKTGGPPMADQNEIEMIESRVDLAEAYDGESIIGELTTDRESGDNQYSPVELAQALRHSDIDTVYDVQRGEGSIHYNAGPQPGDAI